MASLLYGKCEEWTDENGLSVLKVPSPFGGLFYIDEKARDLRKIYNPHFKISEVAKMGSAGLEEFADNICMLFPIMEAFGGFSLEELDRYASAYQNTSAPARLVGRDFMREKKIAGINSVFPTEKLISSCFGKWKK